MADRKQLTAKQRSLLMQISEHGMRRKTGWGATEHWIETTGQRAHPRSVDALFAASHIHVVSLGVEDVIEITDTGRAYLEELAA